MRALDARRCRPPARRARRRRVRRPRASIVRSASSDVVELGLDHEDDRVVARGRCSARRGGRGSGSRRRSCPRWACMLPSQSSASVRAVARRGDARAIGESVTWKPVPKMIVSTSRSVPSARDDRVRRAPRAMPSVTTSTLGCVERRVVVVGDQDALAADRVVGRDLARAAPGRGPACAMCRRASRCEALEQPRLGRRSRARSPRAPSRCPRARPLGGREAAVDRCSARVIGRSRRGMTHGGVRWKTVQLARPRGWMLRDELDGRRAGADDGDALARQVVVVVPLGGVEDRALEVARGRGRRGSTARAAAAGAGDQDVAR